MEILNKTEEKTLIKKYRYKYAAVVVLYDPDQKVISNIRSYGNSLQKVYAVDNSELPDKDLIKKLKEFDTVEYIWNHGNPGLAFALNRGCRKAFSEEIDYVFTMDQDSFFQEGSVETMISYMENNSERMVAAPFIVPYYDMVPSSNIVVTGKTKSVNFAITSGMLVGKRAYQEIGTFDDELFIECIDVDFCIRLKEKNWKLIKTENAVLYQRAGNSQPRKFLWKTVHPLFADPVRGYYKFRNKIYLRKKYGRQIYKFTSGLYEAVLKTLLYEPDKLVRFKFYLKGYIAGVKGHMGSLDR